MICRLLIFLLLVPLSPARAGMITTQEALGERAAISAFLAREDVAARLRALGVETALVPARVAALSDEEARALAGEIDALPAGAQDLTAGVGRALLALLGIALLAVLVIWLLTGEKFWGVRSR